MNNTVKTLMTASLAASMLLPATLGARPSRTVQGAKYVFFFIGDGMSSVQIQSAEAYLTVANGGNNDLATDLAKSQNRLNLDLLTVSGIATTYAADHLITDSAAAGTAMACGLKTNSGVIGMDPTKTKEYKTIAEMAKESGRKVGIITSVSIDHATPASFYANTANRNGYDEVAVEAATSGFDFFGGGSWLQPTSANYPTLYTKLNTTSLAAIFANEGYTTLNTAAAIRALSTTPVSKVVATVPILGDSSAMPYEIDRTDSEISLAEMTDIAIDCLNNSNGFFIMVEGGKVDWAGHANDPMGNIMDMIAFDDAVGKAIEFYKAHPSETLIVVTGDHETGGMTIGFSGRGYEASFDKLLGQKCSYEAFGKKVAAYRTSKGYTSAYDVANNIDADMKTLILDNFGITFDSLSAYRKAKLEDAFDRSMKGAALTGTTTGTGYDRGYGATNTDATVDYLYYGGYDALTMEISHQLSYDSGLGWTSYSHTAIPVPVMAMGYDDYRFVGAYDNTDLPKKIAAAMRIDATLPVQVK
jgi:alkaline phosphatase